MTITLCNLLPISPPIFSWPTKETKPAITENWCVYILCIYIHISPDAMICLLHRVLLLAHPITFFFCSLVTDYHKAQVPRLKSEKAFLTLNLAQIDWSNISKTTEQQSSALNQTWFINDKGNIPSTEKKIFETLDNSILPKVRFYKLIRILCLSGPDLRLCKFLSWLIL